MNTVLISDATLAETISTPERATEELKPGWRIVRFGDVVRNVDVAERKPLENGLERFVGLEHLDPESLHIKRWGLIAEGTSFTRKFVRGQVLFGKRRAYQRKAAVAKFDGICSGDILVFEPKGDELLPELLSFIVQSDGFFEHALGTSAGSLSPRTKWSDLARYEFALPPKDEQRRIADILWAADEALELFKQCVSQAEQLRRNVLHRLVMEGVGHTEFKSTQLGQIPVKWNLVRIGDAGQVQLGRQRAPKYQAGTHPHPYLRVANVFDGYLDLSDVLTMDFDERDYERYVLKPGDILLNEGQSRELVGRSCIYCGEIDGCCFQNTLVRFRASKDVLPEYAQSYFQDAFYRGVFAEISSQTTSIAHLGADRFTNLLMPIPPIDEQHQIARVFQGINQSCEAVRSHRDKVARLKNSLLKEFQQI